MYFSRNWLYVQISQRKDIIKETFQIKTEPSTLTDFQSMLMQNKDKQKEYWLFHELHCIFLILFILFCELLMYVLSLVDHYVKKLSIMFTYVYELTITMTTCVKKA